MNDKSVDEKKGPLLLGVILASVVRPSKIEGWVRGFDVTDLTALLATSTIVAGLVAVIYPALMLAERSQLARSQRSVWGRVDLLFAGQWIMGTFVGLLASLAAMGCPALSAHATWLGTLATANVGLAVGWVWASCLSRWYARLGDAAGDEQATELALAYYAESLRFLEPLDVQIRHARRLLEAGKPGEVIAKCTALLRKSPELIEAHELRLAARFRQLAEAHCGSTLRVESDIPTPMSSDDIRDAERHATVSAMQLELTALRGDLVESSTRCRSCNRTWPTIIAVSLALAFAGRFVSSPAVAQNSNRSSYIDSVPLAAADLEPGMVIREADLGLGPYPVKELTQNTLRTARLIIGRTVRNPIKGGDPFRTSDLSRQEEIAE